jgi:3-oxoacyl-[acyl-carrier-protein] synthase III
VTTYKSVRILSVGTAVPETVMTNKDFEKFLDTSDEWIVTRTGIRERRILPKDTTVTNAELGANAARIALERAGISPEAVDGIVCATTTPDHFFPSTACEIQALLGCKNAFAFDCHAACAGFVYGLSIAQNFIRGGQSKTFLVIGAEIMSRSMDWTDRATCILFGDGAGAAVVQGSQEENTGILSTHLGADGTLGNILALPVWTGKRKLTMKGNEVFKHAVRMMSDISLKVVAEAGLTLDQIDYFIPHQANIRIIKSIGESLKMPTEKVLCNLDRFGNTSSASIPLVLNDAWNEGRIKKGTLVLFTALGGGLASGSAVVRF